MGLCPSGFSPAGICPGFGDKRSELEAGDKPDGRYESTLPELSDTELRLTSFVAASVIAGDKDMAATR